MLVSYLSRNGFRYLEFSEPFEVKQYDSWEDYQKLTTIPQNSCYHRLDKLSVNGTFDEFEVYKFGNTYFQLVGTEIKIIPEDQIEWFSCEEDPEERYWRNVITYQERHA